MRIKPWRKGLVGASWLALALGASAEPVPYSELNSGQGVVPTRGSYAPSPVYGSESAKLHDAIEAAT